MEMFLHGFEIKSGRRPRNEAQYNDSNLLPSIGAVRIQLASMKSLRSVFVLRSFYGVNVVEKKRCEIIFTSPALFLQVSSVVKF